jgi:hypothetical protein
LPESPRFLVS